MTVKELGKTVFKEQEDEIDFVLEKTCADDGSNLTFLINIIVNEEVVWSLTPDQMLLACAKMKSALHHELVLMTDGSFRDD